MKIGVDFGTTHTSAAYIDRGGRLRFVPLDRENNDPNLLRSMLYINREHRTLLGIQAVETYLREDTGRIQKYEEKYVGTVENTVAQLARSPTEPDGPITIIYDVVIDEDVSANGRLLQSIKTGLRDPSYTGTNIFDRFYTIQELISQILRRVRKQSSRYLRTNVREVVLGRPVRFTLDPETDRLAEARLREAAEMAGFRHISFEKEPIAAALFYTQSVTQPETILVFDFGGGTLDMTVMRISPGQTPEILATHGVLVGGDDLDSALMMGRVSPTFGTTALIDVNDEAPFPQQLSALLRRWQTIPQLSRPEPLSIIRTGKVRGSQPETFAALESLAVNNYGFLLFEQVEKAKRILSEVEGTRIQMAEKAINIDIHISRREFQATIVNEVAKVQKGLTQVVEASRVDPEEIGSVVSTGGSSLIPIFQLILQRKFPAARQIQSDTFGSVTAGLALKNS